ncbi:MAG TPA: hypothetical protein VLA77_02595 [Candidatus Saccharimonadales bacterium]|nr:hypothetical protein [Candidatus Saccharimonadales bacterium]
MSPISNRLKALVVAFAAILSMGVAACGVQPTNDTTRTFLWSTDVDQNGVDEVHAYCAHVPGSNACEGSEWDGEPIGKSEWIQVDLTKKFDASNKTDKTNFGLGYLLNQFTGGRLKTSSAEEAMFEDYFATYYPDKDLSEAKKLFRNEWLTFSNSLLKSPLTLPSVSTSSTQAPTASRSRN